MNTKNQKTVLVIEDDADVRNFIIDDLLSRIAGLNFCQAANGHDAIKFVVEPDQCQLIISDYEMPVCDGAGFIQILRDKNIQTPVIVFTGHAAVPIPLLAPVIKIIENKNFKVLLQTVNDWIKNAS